MRSERTAWSNITGLEPLPSKYDMPPPAYYTWADDDAEWYLDTTGPWTDDALEIGIIMLVFFMSNDLKSHTLFFLVVIMIKCL